jgi:hypothetical protein
MRPPLNTRYINPEDPANYKGLSLPATTVTSAPSQYDPGLLPGMSEEEYRSQRQPWQDKLGNGLVNMGTSAFTGAASNTVGLVYGALAALGQGDLSKFWDNEFSQSMDAITKAVRETNPFYYSEAEKQASVLGGMGYQNFWFDKVMGGTGYTLGAMASGMGMARLFQLGKMARLAQLGDEAVLSSTAGTEVTGQLGQAALSKQRWDVAKEFGIGLFMANGESTIEALETAEQTKQFYEEARAKGQRLLPNGAPNPEFDPEFEQYADLTDAQIDQYRKDAGNTNYLANMAITGGTNFLLLRHFVNPGKKAAINAYNTERIGQRTLEGGTIQYFDRMASNKANAFIEKLKGAGLGSLEESFQEFGQYTSSIASQEFVKKYQVEGQDWLTSVVGGLAEGLSKAASEKEGLESALIGAITGAPFGRSKYTERKAEDLATSQLVDALNKDPRFLEANPKVQAFLRANKKANESENYLKQGDIFNAKNASDEALNDYIKSQIDLGTIDYFATKLESLKEVGNEELSKAFGEGTTTQDVDKVLERIENLKKLNNDINTLYGISGGSEVQQKYNAELRQRLFFAASTIKDVEGRLENVQQELRATQDPTVINLLNLRDAIFQIDETVIPKDTDKELQKTTKQYVEEARDKAIDTYNEALEKYQKNNPVEAAKVNELFGDLNKLTERKQDFVNYYNELNDFDSAMELLEKDLKAIQKIQEEAAKQADLKNTAEAQSKVNITTASKVIGLNPNRTKSIAFQDKNIDITKLTDEQLADLNADLELELLNERFVDQESEIVKTLSDTLDAVEKEAEFRKTTQEKLNAFERQLINATPETIDNIVAQAELEGFSINQQELASLKQQLAKAAEVSAAQNTAQQNAVNPSFKGVNEFFHAFSERNTAQQENLLEALGRPDPAKKLYFRVRKNPDASRVVNIGDNPRLKKLTPPIIVELWSGGDGYTDIQIGVMPWYGQYLNADGTPLDIQGLTEAQYKALFGPSIENLSSDPTKYSLEAFKQAQQKAAALYTQVKDILDKSGKDAVSLTPNKSAELGLFSITGGTYNITNEDIPLGEFFAPDSVNKPVLIEGVPVIVSLSSYDGTSSDFNIKDKQITGTTPVASVIDANGNPVVLNKLGDVRAELLPALNALKDRKSRPKVGEAIWNKYWMLVEDPAGTIKIEGSDKNYDWRPVTPAVLTTDERTSIFNELLKLAAESKAIGADASVQAKDTRKALTKRAASRIFIAAATGTENKQYKNVQINFGTDANGLTCTIDLEFYSAKQVQEGKTYRGKIYLSIPESVKSFEDFITFFNAELKKEQDFVYQVGAGKDKIVSRVNMVIGDNIQPISLRSLRKNFAGDTNAEGKKGIQNINPTNVNQSFVINISKTSPRLNQKIKFEPKAKATAQVVPVPPPTQPSAQPQPSAAPVSNKKADIERRLGIKLPAKNTSVPVSPKTWGDRKKLANQISSELKGVVERGVSMQEWLDKGYGRQLATWSDETIVEFLEVADIERRRQEELDKYNSEKNKFNKDDGKGDYVITAEGNLYIDEINAKYDAELNALEGAASTQSIADQIAAITSNVEPAPAAPDRRRRTAGEAGEGGGPVNARGFYSEEDVINYEAALARLRDMLPSWITVEELQQLAQNYRDGKITFGSFYNNVVKISRLARPGTEYHEAFHAIFRTLLTNKEQDILYAEAKELIRQELKKQGKSFNDGLAAFKAERKDYAHLPSNIIQMLYLEEWMADEFVKYKQGKSVIKPKTLLGRAIKYLFDKIQRFAKWFKDEPTLQNLFADIESGKFRNEKTRIANRFSQDPSLNFEANSAIYVGDRVGSDGMKYKGFLEPNYQQRLVNTIATTVLSSVKADSSLSPAEVIQRELEKFGQTFDVNNSIFDPIFNDARFADKQELLLDLDFLFNSDSPLAEKSRELFKAEIEKTLREYSIDEFDASPDESYDGDDNITERSFDLNNENKGGFGSLSKALRKYIATTTYVTTMDEFLGLPKGQVFGDMEITVTVDPKKVYDGIVKLTANQVRPVDILRKMAFFAREEGEGPKFLNKFFEDTGVYFDEQGNLVYDETQSSNIMKVVKGFNLFNVDYLFTEVDRYGKNTRTYEANRRNVDSLQVNAWAARYAALRQILGPDGLKEAASTIKSLGILSVNTKLDESELVEAINNIKQGLESVGIKLSKMHLRYVILANPNREKTADQLSFVEEFSTQVQLSSEQVRESLIQVINQIKDGANPFERIEGEETKDGSVTRLKKIAKDNAVFDEEIYVTSMINADGKNIYPYQKANYHIQKILQLQNVDLNALTSEGELDVDNIVASIHSEQPNRDYLRANYLLNNPVFLAVYNKLKIERIDGLRSTTLEEKDGELQAKRTNTDREGVTYGSMTDRELWVQMYAMQADSSTDAKLVETTSSGERLTITRTMRRVLFNIMEASNTADVITLPSGTFFAKGDLTTAFKDLIFKEIQRELDRINKVKADEYQDKYVLFNAYAKEKDQRGRKFWENSWLLKSITYTDPDTNVTVDLKTALEEGQVDLQDPAIKKLLYDGMSDFFINEIQEHIDYMQKLGIITEKGENRLLHKKFEGGEVAKDDSLFGGTFKDNLANAYLNMYMNNTAINQILMGDPALGLKDSVDWFKRARGNNASGDNMVHFDEKYNKPVKILTLGRVNEEGKFDDFVNKDYVKPTEYIIKIGSPEFEKFLQDLGRENNWTKDQIEAERQRIIASNTQEIKVADAQCYTTARGHARFMNNLGRLSKRGEEIYRRIALGIPVSKEQELKDWEYLKANNLMMNSTKLVYYDGTTYVKMSVIPLTREFTSHLDGTPRRGYEFLDTLRKEMERENIEMAGSPSMMKKMIKNPLVLEEGQTEFTVSSNNVTELDLQYLRLQQENPSNKVEIKDFTQMLQIIMGEQNPNVKVTLPDGTTTTVGELVKKHDSLLAERVKTQFRAARAFMFQLKNGKRDINLKRAVKVFRKTLEQTGASQQLLDFLEVDDQGYPVHNLNFQSTIQAFEQHFNAYFNKIFSQRVPGYKVTLVAALNTKPILQDVQTGKIITRAMQDADPAKYKDETRYVTRDLAFNQPRIINGKEIHRYSEVIIPHHFAEMFDLKPGDEVPEALRYLFGTRIPSQDKHSAMVLKIVDVAPPTYGSTMIAPHELILLTGSDFDIDSFFIHRMDHYMKGDKFMTYGNSTDSKWEQFKLWNKNNNRFVRDMMDELAEDDEELKNVKAEIKDIRRTIKRLKDLENSMYEEGYALTEEEVNLLQRKYNPVTGKSIFEISKEKQKELQEYEDQLLERALQLLEMPSNEQEFNKSDLRSVGEINNELLEIRMILHTNPGMDKINKTPATLSAIEKTLNEIAIALGYGEDGDSKAWQKLEKSYNPNSPLGQVKAFVTNKAGKVAIGAAVNSSIVYTILTRFGIKKRGGDDVRTLRIGDIQIGDISASSFITEEGMRIMDILSTLTSSMTDNTKYGYNSKMNIDIETLGVLSFLTMNRVSLKKAAFLINSEVVKEYARRSRSYAIQTEQEERYQGAVGDIMVKELLKQLEDVAPEMAGKDFYALAMQPITDEDFSISMQYNAFRKSFAEMSLTQQAEAMASMDPEIKKQYLLTQLKFLEMYRNLNKEAQEFIAFSQVIKLTKGISSSTKETSFKGDEDLRNHLKTLDLVLELTKDGWRVKRENKKDPAPLYDFTNVLNNHLISLENLNIFAEKTELQKSYFISQTNLAKEARELVNSSLKKRMKNKVRTKAMTEFRRNFESYLMAKAWMQSLPQEMQDDLNAYLYLDVAKDKGIPSLEDLRNDILGKHPELAHNMIFTQVFFKTKNGENVIEFNTRTKGNKGFTGTLINEMRRLFNSPAKPLIVATLKHLLAKNSLQFRNDSPISIIGPQLLEEVFKVEGVTMSDRTDEYTPILNQKDDAAYKRIFGLSRIELLEEFQEYFMRDINNNAYVTYVKEEVFREDKEDAKSFTPVSETDAGFKVDVDAHLGYNSPLNMFEEGEYSETGEYLGSTEDKSSKELQRRRNRAIFNLFGFEKIIEYYEKKTEDPATKQVTIKKGKTVVYAFPRFIKVGKQLYRLKSYVPLDKRFAKEDKFSTTPNEEGKYIGTAVEYEPVTRWGGNGATPYGRTKVQNEAKNFEATDAARKSAKLESKESAAEDANDYVGEDEVVDNQPLLQSTLQPTTSGPVKTYEGTIESLQPNQIFVFGSNPEGRHGLGTAQLAKNKFGAKYGQGRGLQGQSYGLVTKNLTPGFTEPSTGITYPAAGEKSVMPEQIIDNIDELYQTALANPDKEFLVAYRVDKNLNGYTAQEMANMFSALPIPSNVVFNKEFAALLKNVKKVEVTPVSKQEQLVNKNMSTLVATSLDTTEALLNDKDKLKAELKALAEAKQVSQYGSTSKLILKLAKATPAKGVPEDSIIIKILKSNPELINKPANEVLAALNKAIDAATPEETMQLRKALCK